MSDSRDSNHSTKFTVLVSVGFTTKEQGYINKNGWAVL